MPHFVNFHNKELFAVDLVCGEVVVLFRYIGKTQYYKLAWFQTFGGGVDPRNLFPIKQTLLKTSVEYKSAKSLSLGEIQALDKLHPSLPMCTDSSNINVD